jgi:hypothetical protein
MSHDVSKVALSAQVMFATFEPPVVRCDIVLLAPARWGDQELPAGAPISLSFEVDREFERVSLLMMAQAWAAALAEIEIAVIVDDGRCFVVVSAGRRRLVLGMTPPE